MSVLTDILSAGIGTFVKDVGDTVRSFVTTDGDRLQLEFELKSKAMDFTDKLIGHADAFEAELTKRQQNDMASDSWLSKNIRPLSLIFLLGTYTVLALTDGNINWDNFHFVIKDNYVTGFQSFTEYFVCFYAGGRSLEKIASMVGGIARK